MGVVLLSVVAFRPLVTWIVARRLGPARRAVELPDDTKPQRLEAPRRVAVVGGGLAGIAAASTLGERGFDVVLFEAEDYLGGKIGSWKKTLPDGSETWIGHGYHAFFAHYYNLNRYLDRLGLRASFRSVGDYMILERDGNRLSFDGIATTPILNLLSLARRGVFSFREVVFGPARDLMGIFLEYDATSTFERLDHVSFARFADDAALPRRLRLAFGTFARAFFADEDKMSLAELVKCFHFYFLGHDGGLVYEYPAGDYERTLLAPLRAHLASNGVTLRLGHRVERLARNEEGTFEVEGERFDDVVIATNVVGARNIVTAADGIPPALGEKFGDLRPGQRYAVLRVWIDRRFERDVPVFVITEKIGLLDALAFCDRYEGEAETWAKDNGGAVVELHCYAVPDDVEDGAIRDGLVDELFTYFEELRGANVVAEDLQIRRDFPAFHVGRFASRPEVDSGVRGLHFAGDWVKLDFPAMLMEGAFTSGLVAANRILAAAGLRTELVESVPPRGIMAGMPWPPAREKWVRAISPP